MPELPPPKRTPTAPGPAGSATADVASRRAAPAYAELHCRTNFSFLEGASHPDELVQHAAMLGYAALAITDRHSLAGVVRAHAAAREVGLKLLIGAEIIPADAPPVLLLAMDRHGYGRLCQLLTLGRRRAPKGKCHLTFDDVAQHAAGLLACIPLRSLGWHDLHAAMVVANESRGNNAEKTIANCELQIANWTKRARMSVMSREVYPHANPHPATGINPVAQVSPAFQTHQFAICTRLSRPLARPVQLEICNLLFLRPPGRRG